MFGPPRSITCEHIVVFYRGDINLSLWMLLMLRHLQSLTWEIFADKNTAFLSKSVFFSLNVLKSTFGWYVFRPSTPVKTQLYFRTKHCHAKCSWHQMKTLNDDDWNALYSPIARSAICGESLVYINLELAAKYVTVYSGCTICKVTCFEKKESNH